jgi:outer membrane lipoprotein-sorting protein
VECHIWKHEPSNPARPSAAFGLEVYLNGLRTLKARFLQVSPDGALTEGNAWLQRPGRMRFEYDKPSPFLLVAGFGSAVFYDSQLNQTTSVPLSTTPLGILLADNFKLSGDLTVTAINRLPGQIQVTTIRTSSPGDGSLTLVFSDAPLVLRQWAVIDAQRQETRVSLFNIELGGNFPPRMFEFNDPRLSNGNKN